MNNLNNAKKELKIKYYPKNDIDAYNYYNNTLLVDCYNKLLISNLQNESAKPCPIKPDKYPVVIKPIYNLLGMGLKSFKVNNKEEYNKLSDSGLFFTKYYKGKHFSWDFILLEGKILYSTKFFGKKKLFGSFEYWIERHVGRIPNNVNIILNYFFSKHTGVVNMETIGGKVIEVHLRMGDIDMSNKEIIKLALMCIKRYSKEEILKQYNTVKKIRKKLIYLIPIWNSELLKKEDQYDFLKENWEEEIQNDDKIIGYYFDKPDHPNPETDKRWFLLITHDFNHGINLKNKIVKVT
jgi:hypothetical protein